MNFKFDEKDYDSDKLSDKGKLYLAKLQKITNDQQILSSQFEDNNILRERYVELLKAELPKEEEVKKEKSSKN
jgi:Spy/CpxP family protein refolding chaperone